MNISHTSPPSSPTESSLRLPAQKRISTPNSQRLTTITEGARPEITENPRPANLETPPPIPRRSSRRNSAPRSPPKSLPKSLAERSKRWSGGSIPKSSKASPPPPYEWTGEPIETDSNDSSEVVDKRLEKLRRGEPDKDRKTRGGWKRLALIVGVLLLVIIALAVGLGVGLSQMNKGSDDNKTKQDQNKPQGSQESQSDSEPPQEFPLGEYSLVTALKSYTTDCTSNPATWRCYPDVVYSVDGSTNTTSLASFNWIISNTSSTYATNTTAPTPDEGVPANLTISTDNDPFGITFDEKALTFISTSSNATDMRYTFSFTMPRSVIPSAAITTDNSEAECYFNETLFTADIYLSAERNFPSGEAAESTILAGYQQWPYAVEITQSAYGGDEVPNCYKTVDGQMGEPITEGLVPMPPTSECLCGYRNY